LNDKTTLLPRSLQQFVQLDPGLSPSPWKKPVRSVCCWEPAPDEHNGSVSGQVPNRPKFTVSPNAGYIRNAPGLNRGTSSHLLGYSLSYQAAPGLQFTSSLANVLLFDFQGAGLQRTTVVTVGLNKTFTGGLPSPLPFRQQKGIPRPGFRDLNVDGRFKRRGNPVLPRASQHLTRKSGAVTGRRRRFDSGG
jgi:hypothetical protein